MNEERRGGGGGQLTVSAQEVVEQLEERKAVPGVLRLHLQRRVHVHRVQRQEDLCMLRHHLRPPGKGLPNTHKHTVSFR